MASQFGTRFSVAINEKTHIYCMLSGSGWSEIRGLLDGVTLLITTDLKMSVINVVLVPQICIVVELLRAIHFKKY